MASGPSNEESKIAVAGPPPVPAPRTSKTGNEGHQMCGGSVASPDALSPGLLGALLAAAMLLARLGRRPPPA
jgi:hypothetical protein